MRSPRSATSTHPKNTGITSRPLDVSQVNGGKLYHDYTAAKGALTGFTRTVARDLGPLGVMVNMVAGGLLRTTDAGAATPDAVFDLIAQQTPLGRVNLSEDLADAVLFFASPWARAVTGQTLMLDGRLVCGRGRPAARLPQPGDQTEK